ncbi:histidine acid phosphatase, yeast-enriched transcript [Histoplasma ohiense]|nr:histidine acid phosphatase, yeast-enriched transcript [Histoplasma ohiense (nom. inval.)]
MHLLSLYTALSLYIFPLCSAQVAAVEKVWAAFVFTTYGDSTPRVLPYTPTLTTLGARQLVEVGSAVRLRYPPGTIPGNVSLFPMVSDELFILSRPDHPMAASAQAFMQGFFPPTSGSSNNTEIPALANVVNGSVLESPLGGYQYPSILTPTFRDPTSVYLAGQVNCEAYVASFAQWLGTNEVLAMNAASASFYARIYRLALQGVFVRESVSFFNSYAIYEYLNYQYIHNSTFREVISMEEVMYARFLASQWVSAANGNVNTNGTLDAQDRMILHVAGRTMARLIVSAFETNYGTDGASNKLTMAFGSYEPIVSFALLSGLASNGQSNFYSLPNPGSSMIFELFSMESGNSSRAYPSQTDLMVRFLFRNGTNQPFVSYPLFSQAPSQPGIPYQAFKNDMVDIMMGVPQWCLACGSDSTVFCPAYVPNFGGTLSSGSRSLKPAVAGVIGAVVTLAVTALAGALVWWLFGLRLHRSITRRKPDLGGFKGGDKLASDPDLLSWKGNKPENVIVSIGKGNTDASNSAAARGHERAGSWEMRSKLTSAAADNSNANANNGSTRVRRSFDDDDITVVHSTEPVKVYEHV